MSLKSFHLLFISLSVLLCFGFAVWALKAFAAHKTGIYLAEGIGSIGLGLLLIIYEIWFFLKLKRTLSCFILTGMCLVTLSHSASACSVCFGDPQSSSTKAVLASVFFLLCVIGFVLSVIAGVSFVWIRRARQTR